MNRRTLDLSPRERAEAWLFTGPPGRVLSFSVDMALAMPLLIAHGARVAWNGVRPGRTSARPGNQSPEA